MDALSATGRALCHYRHSCDDEPFSAPQHRPGDPRQLVGEGDDRNIAMSPAHQLFCPTAERGVALGHIGQSRAGSMDQLPARYLLPRLLIPSSFGLPPVVN